MNDQAYAGMIDYAGTGSRGRSRLDISLLDISLYVVATDILRGEQVVLDEGPVARAVRAGAGIIDHIHLCGDGGVHLGRRRGSEQPPR